LNYQIIRASGNMRISENISFFSRKPGKKRNEIAVIASIVKWKNAESVYTNFLAE